MTYDSGNGILVIFGGRYEDDFTNDTWTYNYSNNT